MKLFLQLFFFFGIGFLLWLISKSYRNKNYPLPEIEKADYLVLVISILILTLYYNLISPYLISALQKKTASNIVKKYFESKSLIVNIILFIILSDFFIYWHHRFLHSKILWRFHAFHHSSKNLNWVTGLRGSLVHYIVILSAVDIASIFFNIDKTNSLVFLFFVFFNNFIQHFAHSNMDIPYARFLEFIFITPRYHFIHHSKNYKYANTNFGVVFTVWDKLFQTFTSPEISDLPKELGLGYQMSLLNLFIGRNKKNET